MFSLFLKLENYTIQQKKLRTEEKTKIDDIFGSIHLIW